MAKKEGLTYIEAIENVGYSFYLPINETDEKKTVYYDEIWNKLRKIDIYKYGGQQVYNKHILLDAIYQFPIIKCEDEDLSWNALRSKNTLVLASNGFGKTTFLKGLTLSIISQEKTELDQTEKLWQGVRT